VAQLNVTRAIAGAKLALYKDAAAVWEEKADLSPAKTFEHALPSPESGVAYRFELRDAAGKVLLSHTEGAYEAVNSSSMKLGKQPPDGPGAKRDKPGDFLEVARTDETDSNFQLAENEYRAGLKKFPKDLQLPKALGRLLVMEGRYQDGIGNLLQAGQKLVLDPELHYYLGVAQAATNKEGDARKSWAIAQPDAQYGPPALVEWAMLESRAGHEDVALTLARKAVAQRPKLPVAHDLAGALLRRAKQAEAARQEIEASLALDPTDTAARFENVQNGGKDEDLWPHLAGDPERVLDLAELYMHAGMWADALAILSHPYQAVPANQVEPGATLPQENALVSYYRGYCALKAGQDPSADWKLATTQKLNYVFPHGPEALDVLTAVLQKNAQDASAADLMGLLYLDDYRYADAAEKLQAADASNPNLPAIDYTLGRTLLLLPDKKKDALAVLHKAATADPADKNVKEAIEEANHGPAKSGGAASATPANPVASIAAVAASAGGQPAKTPTSPTEIALAALDRAANGDLGGMGQFTARNFPDAKQPEVILQAYMEMQLQVLRRDAAAKNCADVEARLSHLGSADQKLPLTTQALQPLTSGARYQYFLGAVESLCGMTKEAHAAWTKVAKTTPAVDSPDFAFSTIAAQNLAGKNSKSVDTRGPLDKVGAALAAAKDDSKGVLLYSKGILLLAAGDEHGAVQAFADGVKAPDHNLSHYLNQGALVEASHAAPVK
jgi:tetratricopeptide (TPR) repeat protein